MDFLKSCTTNVLSLDNALSIGYELYTIADNDTNLCYTALAQLRRLGILCALNKQESWKLWIFQARGAEWKDTISLRSLGLELEEGGTLRDRLEKEEDVSRLAVKNTFLNAVEATLSLTLSSQGVYRIGDWKWLYAGDETVGRGAGVLLTLNAKLTDEGNLRISTVTSTTDLRTCRGSLRETTEKIVLAPSGMQAEIVANSADVTVPSLVDGELWRRTTSELLQTQSDGLEHDVTWLPIRLRDSGSPDCVMWPASLCFYESSSASMVEDHDGAASRWRKWFSNTTSDLFQNPLIAAKSWHDTATTALDEESRSVNRLAAPSTRKSWDTAFGLYVEDDSLPSPPPDHGMNYQQAVLSGIYPTPPDGLLTVPGSQQPASDGVESTMQSVGNDLLPLGDNSQIRENSLESLDGQAGYQPSHDDLFGDMEGLDFADNEVGDDDFAYFDEPDETPGQSKILDVDMSSTDDQSTMINHEALDIKTSTAESGTHSVQATNGWDTYHDETMADPQQSTGVISPVNALELRRDESSNSLSQAVPVFQEDEDIERQPEKPLSPFGIKERLLPRPIPASAMQSDTSESSRLRRASLFAAVAFNDGLNISGKYSMPSPPRSSSQRDATSLEPTAIQSRTSLGDKKTWSTPPDLKPDYHRRPSVAKHRHSFSESDEDLIDSSTDAGEDEDFFSTPWEDDDVVMPTFKPSSPKRGIEDRDCGLGDPSLESLTTILEHLVPCKPSIQSADSTQRSNNRLAKLQNKDSGTASKSLSPFSELFHFKKEDMTLIAQVISGQAIGSVASCNQDMLALGYEAAGTSASVAHAIQLHAKETLKYTIADLDECNITQLAASRETFPQTLSPGKGPAHPVARPLQRSQSIHAGPDCFCLPPPYLRVQRGADNWEMLPPALQFWSVLSLGPASGEKDVQVVGISPSSEDLQSLFRDFIDDLGTAYETRKLGTWSNVRDHESLKRLDNYDDGIMYVTLEEDTSLSGCFKAYFKACVDLGKALAKMAHAQPHCTIVICMINPFESEGKQYSQFLCACFWSLWKAFRGVIPKAHRNQPHSDVVLKLLPVELIASSSWSVSLDADRLGELATDIYDRCPPSATDTIEQEAAALSIACAPAVEIALPPPKRINFQLSVDPPSDLLHEGSILHFAYALSPDKQWMTGHWIDSTGKYQDNWATARRGREFADLAQEMWEKTLVILAGRAVTWRVFIAATHENLEDMELDQWRSVIGGRPRKQALLVTLLAIERDPELQLYSPVPTENMTAAGQNNSVFTPVSTPQGTTLTASPDASAQINAPPTPAASDAVPTVSETDPDALLVDLRDESWGMLLPCQRSAAPNDRLLRGLLFKRGDPASAYILGHLQALGVNLRWDLRVRPNGAVEDGPPKQAEITLREVLRMYRSLGILSRAKGLRDLNPRGEALCSSGLIPLHILGALNASSALEGCL